MDQTALSTEFAPAERADPAGIALDASLFRGTLLGSILDALPIGVLVLNEQRQAVYCNKRFRQLVPSSAQGKVVGMRPGEALGCVHACETPGGCGTTIFCRHCGAVQAIVSALRGLEGVRQCHILRRIESGTDALDLQVHTRPFTFGGRPFVLFSAVDVSHEQRLRAMERIFFHDVLNTASGLEGLSGVMSEELEGEHKTYAQMMGDMASQLMEEIQNQKDLSDAERNELLPKAKSLNVAALLVSMREIWAKRREAEDLGLELAGTPGPDLTVRTDPAIVRRVLGNMVKNALEASEAGDVVRMGAEIREGETAFWVANPAAMPEEVKRQVFNRFFSTKGEGRGLGTYGMKLLAERYLGGRVEFESGEGTGTVFRLILPLDGL